MANLSTQETKLAMASSWSFLLGDGGPDGVGWQAGVALVLAGEVTSEFSAGSSSELCALENNSLKKCSSAVSPNMLPWSS